MSDQENSIRMPHPLSVELFSARSNKTTKLINNTSAESAVEGKHRWFEYRFEKPVYIQKIEVFGTGYDSWNEVSFEVSHIDGTKHNQEIKFDGSTSRVGIGKLCDSFRFRPDAKLLKSTTIDRVVVTGLTLDEFHAFEWAIKEFEQREKSLQSREAQKTTLIEEISERTKEKSQLASELGKTSAELQQATQQLESTRTTLSSERANAEQLRRTVAELIASRQEQETAIRKNEEKINELTREIRLFPSEIAGFVKEGNRNIYWYTALSIPFIIVIYVVLRALFSGAVDLTQVWREEQDIDIWTVFLTRLPFVIIAFALLEVCGYVVGRLVFEIIKINRQRLNLSKISIIAKDVSTAASHELELTEDERYEKEVQLKMELLREHMKEYVGQEFHYQGTAVQRLAEAFVSKLGPRG
ncbi:hypothetical protein [Roseicyclus persicicus]|uniref:hypothetical protein n=1 Tax=Roseicyclus persicicus TaxID=2650661 RepID=UPI0014456490|nr:hypothetical protein [Roseibacterium persicicum]